MRGPYEVIEDMHMPTGDFVLRIGSPGVDHTLIWRGTRTNLSAWHPMWRFSFRRAGEPVLSAWRQISRTRHAC
jgi:hypothetical protein